MLLMLLVLVPLLTGLACWPLRNRVVLERLNLIAFAIVAALASHPAARYALVLPWVYFYPRADLIIMRVVDIVMSFPTIILLLIAVSVLGPGIINMMIMIGLITWTVPCRIVRGQFLLLRESDFATAARVVGLSDTEIVTKHILPNATAPLLVFLSLGVASAVLIEAGLSYLGLGVQPPTASWGNMLNAARSITTLERNPWQWIPPAIFTVVFVLAVNFVGDGLRDALDPRGSKDS